jgi:hypothetical protein
MAAAEAGHGGRELVVLYPDAERPVVPRTSGLYHLAILACRAAASWPEEACGFAAVDPSANRVLFTTAA